jgi:hypothetical protein
MTLGRLEDSRQGTDYTDKPVSTLPRLTELKEGLRLVGCTKPAWITRFKPQRSLSRPAVSMLILRLPPPLQQRILYMKGVDGICITSRSGGVT